jgi:predicted MPP superfamily phosphohydrolase
MAEEKPPFLSRRKFVASLVTAGVGSAALGTVAYGNCFPEVCMIAKLTVAGPASWTGKSALFLSDIHYGNFFGPKEAKALQAEVAKQKPDLIILGGDLGHTPSTDLTGFFAGWKPSCPVVFAPGNHDLEIGETDSPVLRQAAAAGVTVLCNRVQTWDGLRIVGWASALRYRQDLSLLRPPEPGFTLLLAHEPDVWDRHSQANVLQLAGHTHGGQIRLFGRPVRTPPLGRKYNLGIFTAPNQRTLLVSAGLGCTALPARLHCPPEFHRLEFV